MFVPTSAEGVPRLGVIRVGDASITSVDPVPVCEATLVKLPTLVIGPVKLALVVTFPAVKPAAVPVMFVPTSAEGVPKSGVISAGELLITNVVPVPVCDVMEVALPILAIGPVKLAFVTTVVALPTLVTIPVRLAFVALLPFSFCMASKILSLAVIIPAPLV